MTGSPRACSQLASRVVVYVSRQGFVAIACVIATKCSCSSILLNISNRQPLGCLRLVPALAALVYRTGCIALPANSTHQHVSALRNKSDRQFDESVELKYSLRHVPFSLQLLCDKFRVGKS